MGINREWVAAGEGKVAALLIIRVDRISRVLIIVEVVSPLKESCDIMLEDLHTDRTVSPVRHGVVSVGHVNRLAYAVVGPQSGHLSLKEGLDSVVSGNRMINNAEVEEIDLRERVHYRVSLEDVRDRRLGLHIDLLVSCVRLVGYVEEATLVIASRLHMRDQLLEEGS